MIKALRLPGPLHQTMDRFVSFGDLMATWELCSLGSSVVSFELLALFVVSCYLCKTFSAAAPSSALSLLAWSELGIQAPSGHPAVPTSQ